MSELKTDRRVRKTRKLLMQGLTKLMEEKSIKDITVRELSELVDINRGTFYLHYRDIYDMLEQIENEIFEEFQDMLIKYTPQRLNVNPLLILTDIFRFISSYGDFSSVMLGKNGDITFVERLKTMVKDKCFHDWMKIYDDNKSIHFEYYSSYIVSGFTGILQDWLNNGMVETPEDMAKFTEKIIVDGIKNL